MKKQKHFLVSLIISVSCLLVITTVQQLGLLSFLEVKTFDLRVQLRRGQDKGSNEVVIVLVDEASLQSMKSLVGRWPWPRSLFAELNYFLAEYGAKAVLFDILFTEPQVPRNSDGELGEDDIELVTSSIENPHVIHAVQLIKETVSDDNNEMLGRALPPVFINRFGLNVEGMSSIFEGGYNNYYLPITELVENSSGIGVVEFLPDDDGIFRRTKLIRAYQGHFFPVLSLAALLHIQPDNPIRVEEKNLIWGDKVIPLLPNGDYLVNPKITFQTLSAGGVFSTIQQIQQGNFDNLLINPEIFKDKIVLVGASAVGVEDLKPIPNGPNFPGVFLHASIISNLLEDDYIKRVPFFLEIIITFIFAFIVAWLITSKVRIYFKSVMPMLMILAYLYGALYLFNRYQIWLSVIFPVMGGMLATYASSFIYMAFTEGRERLRTKKMFSQFVGPKVLAQLMNSNLSLTSEVGSKEELTILFSDIRGFTAISEKNSPEQIVEMLNYYLHEMVELVFKYNGTLDKFIGDAVMAFWGAPTRDEQFTRKAVLCGMEMIEKLKKVNHHFLEKGFPEMKIGIGINSGPVIIGNIGSTRRLDYTVIGDNVNLASRLEGLTKAYGSVIIISEATFNLLGDAFICRKIDQVRVKGKNEPIVLYEPLATSESDGVARENAQKLHDMAEKAFSAYQNREWDVAKAVFSKMKGLIIDDPVSSLFIERCNNYYDNPPPDSWDGTFSFKTK